MWKKKTYRGIYIWTIQKKVEDSEHRNVSEKKVEDSEHRNVPVKVFEHVKFSVVPLVDQGISFPIETVIHERREIPTGQTVKISSF